MHAEQADVSNWRDEAIIPQLLALIYDQVSTFSWQFAQANSKRDLRQYKPKPLKRPGIKAERQDKYGHEPIAIKDFDKWWKEGHG